MKTKFNKRILWMMAAILTLCGSVMFTSCSKDDDDNTKKEGTEKPDDSGANSGDEGDDYSLFDEVKGNVDIKNGGGGVNVVR